LQGALTGAQALGGAFGPLLFSAIYKVTSTEHGVMHGSAWFAAAGVCLVAFVTSLVLPETEVDLQSEKVVNAPSASDSARGQKKDCSDRTESTTYVDEFQPLLLEEEEEEERKPNGPGSLNV
jgi:hypothetical protein